MTDRPKEPQSYGSERDWLTGDTDQNVNRLKGNPNSQHGDFYRSRRESEQNGPDQGGHVSEQQVAESRQPTGPATGESTPVQKVTDRRGGAKTGSYFKKRDYE